MGGKSGQVAPSRAAPTNSRRGTYAPCEAFLVAQTVKNLPAMQETKALISAMTGESRGGSRAAAPGCGFSRGATARSVSLSGGARDVGSPCEWRGGAGHCSRVMVGESGLETR